MLKKIMARRIAVQNIGVASKNGQIEITNTKRGPVSLKRLAGNYYMIYRDDWAYYTGKRVGAIDWLIENS